MRRVLELTNSSASSSPASELKLRGVIVPSTLKVASIALNRKVTYYPDFEDQETVVGPDKEIHCLRVVKSGHEYFSLALLCVDEENKLYERLGLLIFKDTGRGFYSLPEKKVGRVSRVGVQGLPPWWEVFRGWLGEEVELTLI